MVEIYYFVLIDQVTYFYTLSLMGLCQQYSTASTVAEKSAVWRNTMAITRAVQWDIFTTTKNGHHWHTLCPHKKQHLKALCHDIRAIFSKLVSHV
ncbi:MAG: hypothetical protein MJE68_27705, partial [Proteobacteria bacterium]|nr:hypothetical protein [Pseudomonadota bacterium]